MSDSGDRVTGMVKWFSDQKGSEASENARRSSSSSNLLYLIKVTDLDRMDTWLGIVVMEASIVLEEAGTLDVVDIMVEVEEKAMVVVATATSMVDLDILILFLFSSFKKHTEREGERETMHLPLVIASEEIRRQV
ncbi:hypothetical protein Ddye_011960 [Dipteronia dyeriana]|uniref:Uncharacterized protein n=1 Tax=Dipteronia dyeriana TaxID=168575 RepID=A0AAE0CHX8_9ROSI|nr:hypothetical protein Ddye_011960 [Dipteronia dyeriana]